MRFFFLGPRFFGIRPGVSFSPRELKSKSPDLADRPAYVYVVLGEHGRIKIGSTTDLEQRLRNLRTGSAYPLEFAYVREFATPTLAFAVEHEVIKALRNHKTHGDWFDIAPSVGRDLVDRFGDALPPSEPKRSAPPWFAIYMLAITALTTYGLGRFETEKLDVEGIIVWPVNIGVAILFWALILKIGG